MSKKPHEPNVLPSGLFEKPPEEFHDGERFRVRCKDFENVWGEDLTYAEAEKLKEKVAATGRSRSVRIESMSKPDLRYEQAVPQVKNLRQQDRNGLQLQQLRAPALAAAQHAAAAANQRAAARAKKAGPTLVPPAPPSPAAAEAARLLQDEIDHGATVEGLAAGAGLSVSEVNDILDGVGAVPSDDDIAAELEAGGVGGEA